jgi:hypothetical protein
MPEDDLGAGAAQESNHIAWLAAGIRQASKIARDNDYIPEERIRVANASQMLAVQRGGGLNNTVRRKDFQHISYLEDRLPALFGERLWSCFPYETSISCGTIRDHRQRKYAALPVRPPDSETLKLILFSSSGKHLGEPQSANEDRECVDLIPLNIAPSARKIPGAGLI